MHLFFTQFLYNKIFKYGLWYVGALELIEMLLRISFLIYLAVKFSQLFEINSLNTVSNYCEQKTFYCGSKYSDGNFVNWLDFSECSSFSNEEARGFAFIHSQICPKFFPTKSNGSCNSQCSEVKKKKKIILIKIHNSILFVYSEFR